jgi:magnesium transporter
MRSVKTGFPPGTLIHIGEPMSEPVRIGIIDYSESSFQEKDAGRAEECFPFKESPTVTWINVDGVHDVPLMEKLGGCFQIHPLILEDILNTDQRPKLDEMERYIYIVLKMLDYDTAQDGIVAEQVSLVLGSNFVISFQEGRTGDVFNPVRERIRNGRGRIRKMGPDYLAYALMDAIIDRYFLILEKLGEKIEAVEDNLIADPTPDTIREIHQLKRDMIYLRKSVWPLREVIAAMEKSESELIHPSTGIYLRDIYDHTIQIIDTIETYRDMLSGMLDIYLSSISNRMNQVMKVLTIIATIFMPLTFLAGVYGMNFRFMPELGWRWGYPFVLLLMLLIGIVMLIYFKRKKWL